MPLTATFFDELRKPQSVITDDGTKNIVLYGRDTEYGALSQGAVDGFNALCAGWEQLKIPDIDVLAYMMATAIRECGPAINLAIREIGRGKGKKYGVPTGKYGNVYYGRGFPQWTWDYNYVKADALLPGHDFYQFPDRILDPAIGVPLAFTAALKGTWTGVGLRHYITPGVETPYANMVGARHVVNGSDHAVPIALDALALRKCLSVGMFAVHPTVPATIIAPSKPSAAEKPSYGLIAELARLFHRA